MVFDIVSIIYVILVFIAIIIVYSVKNMLKVTVRIRACSKAGGPLSDIGYLQFDDSGAAAEVKLPGGGTKVAVGRVIVDNQSSQNNGYVEVLTSDVEDGTIKPLYKTVGYIGFDNAVVDEYGMIFKQIKGKRQKELIGYTARPSAPNTPTLHGERNWKSLWLVCTLNAYLGEPNPEADIISQENKSKGKKDKSSGKNNVHAYRSSSVKIMGINADAENNTGQDDSDISEDSQPLVKDDSLKDNELVDDTGIMEKPESVVSEDTDIPEAASNESELQDTATESTNEKDSECVNEDDSDDEKQEEANGNEEDCDKQDEQSKDDIAPIVPPLEKKIVKKIPVAVCQYWGFHFSSLDYLPAEARAAAYGVLYQKSKKGYSEYYKNQPYGWLDTALLTSLIFTVIYLFLYIVNTCLLKKPLLGNDLFAVVLLTIIYYLLWVIVRFIKIDCVENSNSFQPKLDLFNKNLSLGGMNYSILVLGIISVYFTFCYYDYDFLPLIMAIMSGVGLNMLLRSSNARWVISSTFIENNEGEDDEEEILNPEGDIARTYDWDLDATKCSHRVHGNLTLYFDANYINDVRQCNPFFAQRKDKKDSDYILDMFHFLKNHRTFLQRAKYIVSVIDKISQKESLSPLDRIQFALDFIQEPNIKFVENKDSKVINYYDDYIRYPDETLYDGEGDCNSKSLLAAMIFHIMGFNVLYLLSRKHQHSGIGVEINDVHISNGWYGDNSNLADLLIKEQGKNYLYCETTGDRFVLGSTLQGINLDDFDTKVVLPLSEDTDDGDVEDTDSIETFIYNWDLDSERGTKLHGNLTLDFDTTQIKELRELNPFRQYGMNANTYEMNIRSIFNYLFEEKYRTEKVQTVADYIKKVSANANLSELEMLQFALDFAQAPNITYCVDENSQGIDFAKEYMRFPDEVLFDKEGDCDCKSSLTTALFHCLGYNVVFMLSQKLGHAAIGLEVNDEWLDDIKPDNIERIILPYNGRRYVYCETTGDGYRIGHINENDSILDFETIVEIPV